MKLNIGLSDQKRKGVGDMLNALLAGLKRLLFVVGAGILELAGGLMLVARLRARWAAVALAVFLVPTAAFFHNPAGLAGMEAQM